MNLCVSFGILTGDCIDVGSIDVCLFFGTRVLHLEIEIRKNGRLVTEIRINTCLLLSGVDPAYGLRRARVHCTRDSAFVVVSAV